MISDGKVPFFVKIKDLFGTPKSKYWRERVLTESEYKPENIPSLQTISASVEPPSGNITSPKLFDSQINVE